MKLNETRYFYHVVETAIDQLDIPMTYDEVKWAQAGGTLATDIANRLCDAFILRDLDHPIVEEAVRTGSMRGFRRSFKYTDNPTRDRIKVDLDTAITTEILEWFIFEDDDVGEE